MLQPNFRKVAFIFDRSISIAFKSGLYGGRYVPRGCNWGTPYFNSRPSARGDASRHRRNERADISIHAPPRGATHPGHKVVSVGAISIHAPPRGATRWCCTVKMPSAISIHAPPRGATDGSAPSCRILKFQFTPLREGRLAQAELSRANQQFQFPPLREGRRKETHPVRFGRFYFNSRPSARGDTVSVLQFCGIVYFNSRPSARGDFWFAIAPPTTSDFNSRPSARGDGKRYTISANLLFNPYKSAWLNHSATQFVEIILVIFHRIIA